LEKLAKELELEEKVQLGGKVQGTVLARGQGEAVHEVHGNLVSAPQGG